MRQDSWEIATRRTQEIVRRLLVRFVVREEARAVVGDQGDDGLVLLVAALEQPLGLLRRQVQAVEERPVALRGRSRSLQEDRIPVLPEDRLAGGQAAQDGGAGV